MTAQWAPFLNHIQKLRRSDPCGLWDTLPEAAIAATEAGDEVVRSGDGVKINYRLHAALLAAVRAGRIKALVEEET